MKMKQTINFWTKEPVEVPPLNIHGFHRVDFQSDHLIIGFFEFGNRAAETLTADDMRFFIGYYCKFSGLDGADLAYDIVGADVIHNTLPNMQDRFLRIRKREKETELTLDGIITSLFDGLEKGERDYVLARERLSAYMDEKHMTLRGLDDFCWEDSTRAFDIIYD